MSDVGLNWREDTLWMLRSAFPDGVTDGEYLCVVELLAPFMAFGPAGDVIGAFSGKPKFVVVNDAQAAGVLPVDRTTLVRVERALLQHGLEGWRARSDTC